MKGTVALGVLIAASIGCGQGGTLPISLEIKDGASSSTAKPGELEMLVKALPGTQVTFAGQTQDTGDQANVTIAIPKSSLKLGKNSFQVSAVRGGFLSKETGAATTEWNADASTFLRFSPGTVGDSIGTLVCSGLMCERGDFRVGKDGHLPIAVQSSISASATVSDKKVALSPGSQAQVDLDLVPMIGQMPLSQTDSLAIPIALDTNSATVNDALHLSGNAIADLAALVLSKVGSTSGVKFGAGDTKPAHAEIGDRLSASACKNSVVAVVGVPESKLVAFGQKSDVDRFADIDVVGVAKLSQRVFTCQPGKIEYNDLELEMYDRRSGKLVGSRKLRADRIPCPTAEDAAKNLTLKGDVRIDDVKKICSTDF